MKLQEQKLLEQTIGEFEAVVYWLKYKGVLNGATTNKIFTEKLQELIDTHERMDLQCAVDGRG